MYRRELEDRGHDLAPAVAALVAEGAAHAAATARAAESAFVELAGGALEQETLALYEAELDCGRSALEWAERHSIDVSGLPGDLDGPLPNDPTERLTWLACHVLPALWARLNVASERLGSDVWEAALAAQTE